MKHKVLAAEFIGTFFLTLTVMLSLSGNYPIPTPILASLTLLLFVYTIGSISGCHINPAVTFGLLSQKKITGNESIRYIVAQLLGGGTALIVGNLMVLYIVAPTASPIVATVAETIGMFIFTFGIVAVGMKKVPEAMSGVVIGGSLLLGLSIAVLAGSPGVLNPAVAIGANALKLPYIVGPLLGAALGMAAYLTLLDTPKKKRKK